MTKLGVIREVVGIHERHFAREYREKKNQPIDDNASDRAQNADNLVTSEFQRSASPSKSPSKQFS